MVENCGIHCLLELKDCNSSVLDNIEQVKQILLEAAKKANATIIDNSFHRFNPHGISGVVVVGESHLAIHTWPEKKYASVDIYTCGQTNPFIASMYITQAFEAKYSYLIILERGGYVNETFDEGIPKNLFTKVMKGIQPAMECFFFDYTSPENASLLKVKELIHSSYSNYQNIEIIDTEIFGRCLVLDNRIQSTELDEFIYHEALVHPALIIHPNPNNVLILGGGEGATLREVLRHNTIKSATMIEIDEEVIKLCQKYLPQFSNGAFDNPRVKVVIEDAASYLERTNNIYDIIISDLTEPGNGLSDSLYSIKFFKLMHNHLRPNGILALQAGSAGITDIKSLIQLYKNINQIFRKVRIATIHITSFAQPWAFIFASDKYSPNDFRGEEIEKRLLERCEKNRLRYYDGYIHQAIFTLPKYIKEALK